MVGLNSTLSKKCRLENHLWNKGSMVGEVAKMG